MTKQELRHDELSDVWERLEHWYEKNSKAITILLVIVLLGILGYKGYQKLHEDKLAQASMELGNVLMNLDQAMREEDEAKRKEQLKGAIDEAKRITRDYSGLPVSRSAQMIVGNAYYYQATTQQDAAPSLKEALAAYQRCLEIAQNAEEKAAAQIAIGNTYENMMFVSKQQDMQKDAIGAYDEAMKLAPGTYLEAEAKLAKANMLEGLTGREGEARKLFTQVENERRLPVIAAPAEEKDKTSKADKNMSITPEQIQKLRQLSDYSYQKVARDSIEAMDMGDSKPKSGK